MTTIIDRLHLHFTLDLFFIHTSNSCQEDPEIILSHGVVWCRSLGECDVTLTQKFSLGSPSPIGETWGTWAYTCLLLLLFDIKPKTLKLLSKLVWGWLIDDCSLELCSATLCCVIWHMPQKIRNKVNSIAWLYCDGFAMRWYRVHYIKSISKPCHLSLYFRSSCIQMGISAGSEFFKGKEININYFLDLALSCWYRYTKSRVFKIYMLVLKACRLR